MRRYFEDGYLSSLNAQFPGISAIKSNFCIVILKNHIKSINACIELKLLVAQNKGKESENSYQKLKRSLKDRHTKTHGNGIEIVLLISEMALG